ncbi:hypothetical protein OQJ18_13780 [Fluoribacter dumoffii]|uniref:hypothetical protein n=1 Tax=Fluoribacter dumoffii TaxID=463 RepID=UPI0002ED4F31|nr:hypothetical protein [Fluoribacter dumoffii]MCW8416833.1 hypothetical protein [Fluoribacter dumoffii]MCW8455327.1 hypothetical protein [Fluoribacter dumoffii]MCW8460595.1 hypothetical protein [Fluoribacter dumoffii]MCW8484076.1 hypothetical protein [Fluoribacter dumoffii]
MLHNLFDNRLLYYGYDLNLQADKAVFRMLLHPLKKPVSTACINLPERLGQGCAKHG